MTSPIGVRFDPLGKHLQDPYPVYAEARRSSPVFFSEKLGVWCVARYDDVLTVLKDHETFSSAETLPRPKGMPENVERFLDWYYDDFPPLALSDPPVHSKSRAVAAQGFRPRVIANFEPTIRRITAEHLDKVAGRAEFDLVTEFAFPLISSVVLELVGIPKADHVDFIEWNRKLLTVLVGSHAVDEPTLIQYGRDLEDWRGYVRKIIEERLTDPRDDLISLFAHSDVRGHRVQGDEVTALVMAMLAAGVETTAAALSNSVEILLRQDEWASLDDNPDELIAECIRLNSSLAWITRVALRDTEIAGQSIRSGDMVSLLWNSACHDEDHYPEPTAFRPARSRDTQELAFGHGIHYCVGAPLSRIELRVALTMLRERFPNLRLVSREPSLYRPVATFRVLDSLLVTAK
ncbi:cytochrome P450 [Streptomyces sp. NPDC051662]|uniref:cytochrome P450 n=1 Tax=Streptomyces sp. NPDC051662 TaxID=3154750 RepID=UPI003415876B